MSPPGQFRSLITGLLSLAVLAAITIGLPLALYRFGGSPLPHHLPGWQHLIKALRSRDDGALALAAVRDISWIAWLLFTASVLGEAQAAVRGRPSPRLRLGGLQGAAAHLVALAAVTFAAPAAVALTAPATAMAAAGHAMPGSDGQRSPAGRPVVTVRAGDCLWAIAQHYLGAGDRYGEIVSLNYGRDMGNGQVFTNPALIEPGWHLQLPATAATALMPAAGMLHHLGHATSDAHFRRRHAASAQRIAQDATGRERGSRSSQPSGSGTGPGPATGPSEVAAGQHADPVPASAAERSGGSQALVFAAGALAGSVLAGSVLVSLGKLRRRQRQYRRRGRRIPLPSDPDVLAVERRLRAVAPDHPPSTLRDALAWLQAGIVASEQPLPDIIGLHVTPAAVEVLLSAPAADSPPPPYKITPGRQGMCWQLDLPAESGAAAAPSACYLLPGLFTAGATADGYLLLDLEALQVTGCDGPPELVDQVITAAATELATGQWAGWYELILVGCAELQTLGRAEHCGTLDEALDLLETRALAARSRLTGQPWPDVRDLRLSAPHDEDWGLTVLVSRTQPESGQLTRLLELAEDGPGGIAALVAGDPETADGRMAPTVLQLAPAVPQGIVANVVPLQITVRPQVLSPSEYQAIATLFATAAQEADVSPEEEPYEMYAAPPWIPQSGAAPGTAPDCDPDNLDLTDGGPTDGGLTDGNLAEESPPDGLSLAEIPSLSDGGPRRRPLRVCILGPFLVDGALEQLQPKQAELVLALALAAPAALSNSALCSMLGADPDHPKPSDAIRQVITRTRRRLGRSADGREYVIHAGNGNYLLHEDVSLDWTQFRELVRSGQPADLRAALSLVRGQPFAGCFHWWIDIPLLETVRAEVVDAAETLAEFELSAGSARAAARAARAGLTADVSAEQLWRILMRAEHAAGNLAGVTEAWRRCLDAIEDIAPDGEPHPDTSSLYHQLTTPARPNMPV